MRLVSISPATVAVASLLAAACTYTTTTTASYAATDHARTNQADAYRYVDAADDDACSAGCLNFFPATAEVQATCQQVCDAVEAQSDTPCGQALLGSSFEHLTLLSYSSGHVAESLAILLGALAGNSSLAEDVAFFSDLRLNDRGSPQACGGIEHAHYCLGQVPLVASVGVCLPQSCDSASVLAFLASVNASSLFPSTIGSDDDDPTRSAGSFAGSTSFTCGDELRIYPDAGTVSVLSFLGVLVALVVAGTAMDYRHRSGTGRTPSSSGSGTWTRNTLLDPHINAGRFNTAAAATATATTTTTTTTATTTWATNGMELGGAPESTGHNSIIISSSERDCLEHDEDPAREPLLPSSSSSSRVPGNQNPACFRGGSSSSPPGESGNSGRRDGQNYNSHNNNDNIESSSWRGCLECFSLMLNMDKLVAPPRAGDEFGALDGVRTLSMMWVVLGHVLIYALSGPGFTNTVDVLPRHGEGLLARLSAQVLPGGFLAVDTFFLMSGFLLSSVLLPKLASGSLGRWRWIGKAYLHRYLRLTPTLAFTTFFVWKVLPLLGEGPGWWPMAVGQADRCRRY
ncbi:unnamed protein product, partial [Laminaria digitata]